MTVPHDEVVNEGTRRVVGREALRRASRMVRQWQADELEKQTLARDIAIGLAILAAALFIAIRFFY
jgi:RNA polymerase-interacting CarD/CdnL/TRCF family regulator